MEPGVAGCAGGGETLLFALSDRFPRAACWTALILRLLLPALREKESRVYRLSRVVIQRPERSEGFRNGISVGSALSVGPERRSLPWVGTAVTDGMHPHR